MTAVTEEMVEAALPWAFPGDVRSDGSAGFGVSAIRHAEMKDMVRHLLTAALAAKPEGWVLVPIEPTEAMIEAYCTKATSLGFHAWVNLSALWPDVLAAAPAASGEGG